MKVKCEIILPDVSVLHDDHVEPYSMTSVSIVYQK